MLLCTLASTRLEVRKVLRRGGFAPVEPGCFKLGEEFGLPADCSVAISDPSMRTLARTLASERRSVALPDVLLLLLLLLLSPVVDGVGLCVAVRSPSNFDNPVRLTEEDCDGSADVMTGQQDAARGQLRGT